MKRKILYILILTGIFCFKAAAETVLIPAVSFTGEGEGKVEIKKTRSLSYVHLWSAKGHWLEWNVEAKAGVYGILVTYGSRYPALREFKLNGEVIKGLEEFEFKDAGGWTKWKDERLPVSIKLKNGNNIIRITCLDGSSLCLNKIKFTGNADIAIDAVSFNKESGGKAQVIEADPAGYISIWDKAGHWLEWAFEYVPVNKEVNEAVFEVYITYATLADAKREIKVNGEPVSGLQEVTFEYSGGWRNWIKKRLPAEIKLKKGKNIIRMTNLGATGLNLSFISIEKLNDK